MIRRYWYRSTARCQQISDLNECVICLMSTNIEVCEKETQLYSFRFKSAPLLWLHSHLVFAWWSQLAFYNMTLACGHYNMTLACGHYNMTLALNGLIWSEKMYHACANRSKLNTLLKKYFPIMMGALGRSPMFKVVTQLGLHTSFKNLCNDTD